MSEFDLDKWREMEKQCHGSKLIVTEGPKHKSLICEEGEEDYYYIIECDSSLSPTPEALVYFRNHAKEVADIIEKQEEQIEYLEYRLKLKSRHRPIRKI